GVWEPPAAFRNLASTPPLLREPGRSSSDDRTLEVVTRCPDAVIVPVLLLGIVDERAFVDVVGDAVAIDVRIARITDVVEITVFLTRVVGEDAVVERVPCGVAIAVVTGIAHAIPARKSTRLNYS